MEQITRKAYAKINLVLDVTGRLPNGYHEVSMVMQNVGIHDTLTFTKRGDEQIVLTTSDGQLPLGEDNLIYKAVLLLRELTGNKDGVTIHLEKRIPVAAGMAGGSTDAAAALYGMNQMFDLGLNMEQLKERGVKIGADVPYCLMRGTALAEGIGEKLTALPPMPKCPVLVAKPSVAVSTKFVYENLHLENDPPHPDIDRLLEDIRKKDLQSTAQDMGNILETVTVAHYPEIASLKEIMKEHGALNALMSGSGPTVFGLFEDEKTAKRAYRAVKESGLAKQLYLTTIYNNRK